MGTMVDRESMENGARGRIFTRHVPGIVTAECSTGRDFAQILAHLTEGALARDLTKSGEFATLRRVRIDPTLSEKNSVPRRTTQLPIT